MNYCLDTFLFSILVPKLYLGTQVAAKLRLGNARLASGG